MKHVKHFQIQKVQTPVIIDKAHDSPFSLPFLCFYQENSGKTQ